MVLLKEGLWLIVSGNERAPPVMKTERHAKFVARRDRTTALIVLSIDSTLLYLLEDRMDPVTMWKKLSDRVSRHAQEWQLPLAAPSCRHPCVLLSWIPAVEWSSLCMPVHMHKAHDIPPWTASPMIVGPLPW